MPSGAVVRRLRRLRRPRRLRRLRRIRRHSAEMFAARLRWLVTPQTDLRADGARQMRYKLRRLVYHWESWGSWGAGGVSVFIIPSEKTEVNTK